MPWALWAVVALLVSMLVPWVGYWVAYFTMIFTFLATYSLPAIVASLWSPPVDRMQGPIAITQFVRTGGAAPTGWAYLWGLFGWTGVVWAAATAILWVWIAIKLRMGQSAHGLVNLLILIVGWPIGFWLAMAVMSNAAPR